MSENKGALDEKAVQEKKKSNSLIEWVKSLICAIILAYLIMNFVVFIGNVPTGSMIPTISEHSKIAVWKCFRYLDWENRGVNYGDIVVFHSNNEEIGEDKLLVKRVIGMGGDTISIDNGIVYRNGEKLDEPYVKNKDSFFMKEIEVPEHEIFVLGDNRIGSFDSRYWDKQTVPIENVVGEVKFLLP